jgi:hypothetical protein
MHPIRARGMLLQRRYRYLTITNMTMCFIGIESVPRSRFARLRGASTIDIQRDMVRFWMFCFEVGLLRGLLSNLVNELKCRGLITFADGSIKVCGCEISYVTFISQHVIQIYVVFVNQSWWRAKLQMVLVVSFCSFNDVVRLCEMRVSIGCDPLSNLSN